MIDIMDYIPRGKDNAVTREQLVEQTGIKDRTVRRMIHKKRQQGEIIISSTRGKGYYLPLTRDDAEGFIRQQKSYIKHIQESITKAERLLRKSPDQTEML